MKGPCLAPALSNTSRHLPIDFIAGLPGCVCALDTTFGITLTGSKLSTWRSRVGNLSVTQSVDATRPTYVVPASGLPYLACGAGAIASGLDFPAGTFGALTAAEAFLVYDYRNSLSGSTAGVYTLGAEVEYSLTPQYTGTVYDLFGATVRKTVGPLGSAADKTVVYNPASGAGHWSCRRNGTQLFATATNTFGMSATPALLYSRFAANPVAFLAGRFSACFMFDHILAADVRSRITAALVAFYGVV